MNQPGSAPTLTVSVIGCGYLGAIHAAAMAELGHRVIGWTWMRSGSPP